MPNLLATERRCILVDWILNFFVSITASVMANYISKWLGGDDHDKRA